MTPYEFNQIIQRYIEQEFPEVQDFPAYWEYTRLEDSLKTLILWDRYNKEESIIEGLEFEWVRRVLYNFNTRNLIAFLSTNWNSLLFYHYFDLAGEKDSKSQTNVDPETLYKEMVELYKKSENVLKFQWTITGEIDDQHQSKLI